MSLSRSSAVLLASAALGTGMYLVPLLASAATCDFTRDLELGVTGEDVRCLQQFLNGAGFTVATDGVGSPGNETSLFREKTRDAVAKWQAANGLPATGFFGPASRAKYGGASSAAPSTPGSTGQSALQGQVDALLQKIQDLKSAQTTATTGSQKSAQTAIEKALSGIEDAEDQIDDAEDDGDDVTGARENSSDAKDDLFDAIRAYFAGDYAKALTLADRAYGNAEDAFEDAGGESKSDKVDDYIDELDDRLDDAWDKVDDSDADDDDIDDAENLLDKADAALEDAKDALDDDDTDSAEELGEKAEDYIDDALDAIRDSDDESDAEDTIKEAKSKLNSAWKKVRPADNDDAEDYMNEAEDLIDDAEESFDDEEYDDAIDSAEEAMDRIEDALDEI